MNSCSDCECDANVSRGEDFKKRKRNRSRESRGSRGSRGSMSDKSYISFTDSDISEDDIYDDYDDYYRKSTKKIANLQDQIDELNRLKNEGEDNHFRPIEKYRLSKTLIEAVLYPEKAKGFKFPAPFQTLSYSFQQKNSFYVKTNAFGNCFIQITLGQYLDETQFKTGTSTANALGIPGSQNGTSAVGQSNVFVCNHSSLNGTTPIANTGDVLAASNVNMVSSELFNMVKAGPMSVQWDYTGRIDAVSGTLTAGINYTKVTTPTGIVAGNDPFGLYPDSSYSVLNALEG